MPKAELTSSRPSSAGTAYQTNEEIIAEAMRDVDRSQELTRTIPLALLKVGEDNVRNGKLKGIGEWRHILVNPQQQRMLQDLEKTS